MIAQCVCLCVCYLVQVVGTGVHPLPQDVPLLPSKEPPERREAVDLQTVQPDRETDTTENILKQQTITAKQQQLPSSTAGVNRQKKRGERLQRREREEDD